MKRFPAGRTSPAALAGVLGALLSGEALAQPKGTPIPAGPPVIGPPFSFTEPEVTDWSPKNYVIQGELVTLRGSSLKPHDLKVEIFTKPPVRLTVDSSGPGFVNVRVPANFSTAGQPVHNLVVWYERSGTGLVGPKKVLSPPVTVLKRPRVASFRVTEGPHLKYESDQDLPRTSIEVELADFNAYADSSYRPRLFVSGCQERGHPPTSEPGGNPWKLKYDLSFTGIDLSGKRCVMEVRPYGVDGPRLAGGESTLPRLSIYRIESTWDLLDAMNSSGKKLLSAIASRGGVPCQAVSVGTAGNFATGVVKHEGDFTFQLRNGAVREDCIFETSPSLTVRRDWYVKSATWKFVTDSLCDDHGHGTSYDHTTIPKVRFEAHCKPDLDHLPKNSHLYRAQLDRIELVGPAGKTWQEGFK